MKIGIFGGTFDPPHISHTMACLFALETTEVEKIIIIPCFRHPLGKQTTSFQHRVSMCHLAMKVLGQSVGISEIEAQRKGPSYTIDTLRILKEQMPNDDIYLLVGSDILKEKHLWKNFPEIRRMAGVIVIPRPAAGKTPATKSDNNIPFTLPDISSTMVRERLRAGQDVSQFISMEVYEYIRRNNLYPAEQE